MITGGSLFSGIGGMDLAAAIAGIEIRFQVEIDEYCRKVLAKHASTYWKDATQFADVRRVSGRELGYVDILFGGFPCQDISQAGLGAGLEGARSGLWWEFYRLIGEIRPRAVVLENVAAIAYDGRGGTEVIAALAGLGYSATWGIVSAADAGAPHERKRWFCVGYRDCGRYLESNQAGRASHQNYGHTRISECNRKKFSSASESAGQVLPAKTGLAYPYRQRRTESRGYRAEARERLIGSGAVGNTHGQYVKEQCATEPVGAQLAAAGCTGSSITGKSSANEPGMGRDADGLPARMDGTRLMQHQFPSRPNEAQLDSEPPRLCDKIPNRRNRIKALGNAVVPQVIYPIFKLLVEVLEKGGA